MTLLPPTEEPVLCPLFCGQPRHEEPGPAPYGMTCPGFLANVDEANAFTTELGFRKEVAAAYGETLASSPEYVELLQKRRTEADQRVAAGMQWSLEHPDEPHKNPLRSEVTHEHLQQAVNELVPEVIAKIDREIKRPVVEAFEPVIKPLRVPPKDLSRRGPRIELPPKGATPERISPDGDRPAITEIERKQAEQVDDAAIFLNPEAD